MSQTNSHVSSQPRRYVGSGAAKGAPLIDAAPPSDEAIAMRAYDKYVARGRVHGFDEEDWASAKRELIAEAFEQ